MVSIRDVPCSSCVQRYGSPHTCDEPRYCPCDQEDQHPQPRTLTIKITDRGFYCTLSVNGDDPEGRGLLTVNEAREAIQAAVEEVL